MSNVNTYNPSDVYLIISGLQVEGWKDITVKRSTPAFKHIKGIRGKHTRSFDKDTSATITVSVIATGELNDWLTEIHQQDIDNGTGRLEITLIDKSGTSSFNSIEAYITEFPEKPFTDSIEFITWTIQCQSTEEFIIGGNTQPDTQTLKDVLKILGIK